MAAAAAVSAGSSASESATPALGVPAASSRRSSRHRCASWRGAAVSPAACPAASPSAAVSLFRDRLAEPFLPLPLLAPGVAADAELPAAFVAVEMAHSSSNSRYRPLMRAGRCAMSQASLLPADDAWLSCRTSCLWLVLSASASYDACTVASGPASSSSSAAAHAASSRLHPQHDNAIGVE